MARQHVIVIGAGLAGLAAATEIKERLGVHHDVTVIAKTDQLVRTSSLPQLPFGKCDKGDICSAIAPLLERQGIRFQCDEMVHLDPAQHSITTKTGHLLYDHLLLATGAAPNFAAIPGLGPRGYTQSIATLAQAESTQAALARLLQDPGPVLIGAIRGSIHREAVHSFLLNMTHWVSEQRLGSRIRISYIADGPDNEDDVADAVRDPHVESLTNASIVQVRPNEARLADGRRLPFAFAMLMPPVLGVDCLRKCEALTNASGFVRVDDHCQSVARPEIFAAGDCATRSVSEDRVQPDHDSESAGRIAAHNLVTRIQGGEMRSTYPLRPAPLAATAS